MQSRMHFQKETYRNVTHSGRKLQIYINKLGKEASKFFVVKTLFLILTHQPCVRARDWDPGPQMVLLGMTGIQIYNNKIINNNKKNATLQSLGHLVV